MLTAKHKTSSLFSQNENSHNDVWPPSGWARLEEGQCPSLWTIKLEAEDDTPYQYAFNRFDMSEYDDTYDYDSCWLYLLGAIAIAWYGTIHLYKRAGKVKGF